MDGALEEYLQVNRTLHNGEGVVDTLKKITKEEILTDIFNDDLTIVRRCIRKRLGKACHDISREDVYRVLYGNVN